MNERKLQILLVDDHAVVRGGLRLLLAQTDDMEVVVIVYDAETSSVYSTHGTFEEAVMEAARLNPVNGLGMRVV